MRSEETRPSSSQTIDFLLTNWVNSLKDLTSMEMSLMMSKWAFSVGSRAPTPSTLSFFLE
jgi:hypothetical protein